MKLSRKKIKTKHYLVVWDMYGLEALFDVDKVNDELIAWEKSKIWSLLKEEEHSPKPRGIPLNFILLRARVNSQRKYEVYEFTSQMTEKEIRDFFKTDPNTIAKTIRELGYKVYSDRSEEDKRQVVF